MSEWKNIVALIVNDKQCGVVSSNGAIRILKRREKKVDFIKYLKLQNERTDVIEEINDTLEKIKNNQGTRIKGLCALIFSILIFVGAPMSIITSALAFIGAVTSMVVSVNSSQLIKHDKLEVKESKKYLKEIENLLVSMRYDNELCDDNDYIFVPKKGRDNNATLIEQSFVELKNFFANTLKEDIHKVEAYCLDRELEEKIDLSCDIARNDHHGRIIIHKAPLKDNLIYKEGEEEEKIMPPTDTSITPQRRPESGLSEYLIFDENQRVKKIGAR